MSVIYLFIHQYMYLNTYGYKNRIENIKKFLDSINKHPEYVDEVLGAISAYKTL